METSPYDRLAQKLKQAGMRITPQRMAICKLLCETDTHPTAVAIFDNIRQQYPSLSLMTVYNTLNVLVDLGMVNVLGHAGDDTVHYDADTEPHVNLACVKCHQIIDVSSESVHQLNDEIGSSSGYKLLGARVLYYGVCPACQK
jgi:Fur family transcriptional regulator, peroxide stress response regulator